MVDLSSLHFICSFCAQVTFFPIFPYSSNTGNRIGAESPQSDNCKLVVVVVVLGAVDIINSYYLCVVSMRSMALGIDDVT